MNPQTKGRVLIVAASDSGGGAGIQADIKTVMALGGYGTTALTALTAQNTQGVFGIEEASPEFVAQQMRVILEDIGADVVKIGMLASARIVEAVAGVLASSIVGDIPVVLDTVMVSTSGARLLAEDAVSALQTLLLPRALVATPNLPETRALTGIEVRSLEDMHRATEAMLRFGCRNVLIKGGHFPGGELVDLLAGEAGRREFRHKKVETVHTHGTGCTLASAIAVGLAQGMALAEAAARAEAYVQVAIKAAPGLGRGHGPLGHGPLGHGRGSEPAP